MKPKGPHTRSNKFVQRHVVQQENNNSPHTHNTISLHKLQFLGKFHKGKMSKATCLAIILAYTMEEETVHRNR